MKRELWQGLWDQAEEYAEYLQKEKGLRKGQSVYNAFYNATEHFDPPTLDNKEIDCYYRDDKVDEFLESLKNDLETMEIPEWVKLYME